MNMIIRNRIVGTAVLVLLAALVLWLFVAWVQSGSSANNTNVRVYEIDKQQTNAPSNNEHADKTATEAAQPRQPTRLKRHAVLKKAPDTHSDQQASDKKQLPDSQSDQSSKSAHASRSDNTATTDPEQQPDADQAVETTVDTADESTSQGSWVIQVGSFSKKKNAQDLKQQIAGKYSVTIVVGLVSGTEYHRVRIGPYDTAKAAHDAKQQLQRAGYATQLMYTD